MEFAGNTLDACARAFVNGDGSARGKIEAALAGVDARLAANGGRLLLGEKTTDAITLADVAVTAEVLEAQLERYADLPSTVAELEAWIRGQST